MSKHLLDLSVGDVSSARPLGQRRPARAGKAKRAAKPAAKAAKPKPRQRKGLSMKVNTQTGQIHVRHLSDIPVGGKLVRFGAVGEAHAQGGKVARRAWCQIAKPGSFAGHSAGPFELNAKVFDEIVRNFRATHNKRIPLDFEHASESDPTQGSIPHLGVPAQGWALDLDNRGDAGLWGLIEFLEPARTYVEEDRYKWFSPAVRFGARDRVTGKQIGARLTSIALTNQPFLDGLAPLVCRDFDDRDRGAEAAVEITGRVDADPVALSDLLLERIHALSERAPGEGDEQDEGEDEDDEGDEPAQDDDDADEDDDTAGAPDASPNETPEGGDAEEGSKAMADRESAIVALTEAQAKTAELTAKLSDAQVKNAALEGELIALRAREKDRDEREVVARVTEAFETYKDTKKLSDVDREVMLATCRTSRDLFEKQYPHVPAGARHLMRDLTSDKRDGSAALPLSNTADVVQLSERNLAKQISAQKGIPLEQAQQLVARLSAKR